MKTIDYLYNKHIRAARRASRGLAGLERAKAIYHYFEDETIHPHAWYTYREEMLNRSSDHQFPIDLMKEMAMLTATNEYFDLDSQTNKEGQNLTSKSLL
ncbi:conserved hypothetical protein [Vibrio chagasii]|nr:conserved hypothetical protein [Vibrio chagasii]CAH7166538.1 conserved hypothetical protein [Vibrio chagasii]CAH7336493.1 conserved hypothetical protein [Vibrio chagasii]CAH7481492.1 conserved hypothetical protein [Vibrio chagasii]